MVWWWWRKSRKERVLPWCATVAWPVCLVAQDDGSFFLAQDLQAFVDTLCEVNDVDDGLYQGWDASGRSFVPVWDKETGSATIHERSAEPDWSAFRAAVETFCESYKNYRRFRPGDCTPEILAAHFRSITPPP